jgi:TM2 domain-containing membrane protein YozV
VNYYVAEGTSQRGPFTEQELPGVGLRPDQLVWGEGMPQWLPANQVPELQAYLNPAAAPAAQPFGTVQVPGAASPFPAAPLRGVAPVGYATPQAMAYLAPSDISGKKLAAGLCGIILGFFGLGGLGVHKFVLGLNTGAVTLLGITLGLLVLGFFTCGLTFFILPLTSLIGLIEGIIYLTKSDAEFYHVYMIQKRQWF